MATPPMRAGQDQAYIHDRARFPGFGGVLFAVGSRLFGFGRDLWVTDGTAAGTTRLLSGRQGLPLAVVDGVLHFAAPRCDIPCSDEYLWRTDGTAAGTYLVEGFTQVNAAREPPRFHYSAISSTKDAGRSTE